MFTRIAIKVPVRLRRTRIKGYHKGSLKIYFSGFHKGDYEGSLRIAVKSATRVSSKSKTVPVKSTIRATVKGPPSVTMKSSCAAKGRTRVWGLGLLFTD